MMIREELKRLLFEADEESATDLMQVEVICDGNAWQVLERATEALAVILSVENICNNKDEWQTDDSYKLLESWFESNVLPHINDEDDDDVSRDIDKVRWFGEGRDWFWWTARVLDDNRLFVYIMLDGFPVSGFDNLRWLLQCCGASQVEQGPAVGSSDIPAP